jgi:hypothetical protein
VRHADEPVLLTFLEGTGLSTNPILTIVALLLCVETVQDSCAG